MDMTCPICKPASRAELGTVDTALPGVQAAASEVPRSRARADAQSSSRYQASSQNLVKSAGDIPFSVSDIGKEPTEYK